MFRGDAHLYIAGVSEFAIWKEELTGLVKNIDFITT